MTRDEINRSWAGRNPDCNRTGYVQNKDGRHRKVR